MSCGPGAKLRVRECEEPKHGGKNCEGPAEEKMHCEEKPCPGNIIVYNYTSVALTPRL